MSRFSIEMLIANKTYETEKRNSDMLAHDRLDQAVLSFGAFCGVLSLANETDRPAVHLPCRMIGRNGHD